MRRSRWRPSFHSLPRRPADVVLRRASMRGDERARVDPSSRVLTVTRPDERRHEFAHLEVKMRPVPSVRGPDRRDLLAPMDDLFGLDHDGFDVAIIRLHEFALALLLVGVKHDNDVAPTGTGFAGKNHSPIRHGENGVAL